MMMSSLTESIPAKGSIQEATPASEPQRRSEPFDCPPEAGQSGDLLIKKIDKFQGIFTFWRSSCFSL